jgi:hypothetical protein
MTHISRFTQPRNGTPIIVIDLLFQSIRSSSTSSVYSYLRFYLTAGFASIFLHLDLSCSRDFNLSTSTLSFHYISFGMCVYSLEHSPSLPTVHSYGEDSFLGFLRAILRVHVSSVGGNDSHNEF